MFDSDFVIESLEFIEESEALLLNLEGQLDHYKNQFELTTAIAPFVRCLHSLKGASSMYGLNQIVDFAHNLEQKVIAEISILNKEHVVFYLRELDKLRNVFEFQDEKYLTSATEFLISSEAPILSRKERKQQEPVEVGENKKKPDADEVLTEIQGKTLIAFVDNEEMIHEIFVEKSRDQNWDVKSFFDPTQIKDFDRFDLFIIDYMMPEMSGLELIEKIRARESKVPIILLSGFVTKELCLNAFQFEHVIVVEKSASLDILVASSKQQVEKYHAYKLLGRSLDLIKYHFGDLHVFLKAQGLDKLSKSIARDIQILERERRKLKI